MKRIRITEDILRQIVKESVKKVLKESKGMEPGKRDKEYASRMAWDGEPDLNKSNEWRKNDHYSSRGKKKVKGDTSARDLFRRENEKGNFVHKLKTNPGEWVKNMCKTSLKESDFNDNGEGFPYMIVTYQGEQEVDRQYINLPRQGLHAYDDEVPFSLGSNQALIELD